ncbi:MAG: excinuclease ABC subunit UvrA [Pirellulales bacterium]|nr:excinuclease ABC subunit UvrA [Pirellulales bacterium]
MPPPVRPTIERTISLRGVEVHNLKRIDLDLPHRRLIVFCGVSGSGKSSLAFDTLYAEGQRRYIETFSAYTRQFLEQLEKPTAERIDGIPAAIAVGRTAPGRSSRSTVGTVTETTDYLRLLMARIGQVVCLDCRLPVRRETPQSVAATLAGLPQGTRFMLAFARTPESGDRQELVAALREDGLVRVVAGGHMRNLTNETAALDDVEGEWLVIVDRLTAGQTTAERLRDSLETAFAKGDGSCVVLVDASNGAGDSAPPGHETLFDGTSWRRSAFSNRLQCDHCGREYPLPEPRLYSFNSPLGACPTCEGFGNVMDVDMELVVPDANKSLREGAIAPWNTPSYAHELEELLTLAGDYGIDVDVPYATLGEEARRLIDEGVPDRKFGGLRGFFAWLERRKYKMHIRVFLSRWRSYHPCPDCNGARLRPESLATEIGSRNLAQICALKIRDAADFFARLELNAWQQTVGRMMLEQVRARLGFLCAVGLDYLTLDRTMRTTSGGEAQRIALTTALGSSLVNMLYVLDEPSVGLHPRDTERLLGALRSLRDRGNTVVVVEHEEAIIRAADHVVEIGPGAGERGGQVVFQGTPRDIEADTRSATGDYLSGRRQIRPPQQRRKPNHGWIRLVNARGNNLQNLTVEFPLGVLCVVSGVSGAGKSTLVQDTLYPALCRRMRKEAAQSALCDDVLGDGQLDDVILVDQSPVGRTPRSNPVTYLKAFDEIRAVFADTFDARMRNYTPSHFSFNVDGGRCPGCEGDGYVEIDMQFLPDVFMKCSQCDGQRYRPEILEVLYRGRSIADVLQMTVREAFTFFRGSPKVQVRLKRLIDVGLDYLRLGQPANTLSGGEAQRLKLAAYLSTAKRGRCLFLLDEPTTGLHFQDIVQLLDCFDALLAVGHSLIVVEHNLQMIAAADYIIDLGPGAADEGGRLVATGTPEAVSRNSKSITGKFLSKSLAQSAQERSA